MSPYSDFILTASRPGSLHAWELLSNRGKVSSIQSKGQPPQYLITHSDGRLSLLQFDWEWTFCRRQKRFIGKILKGGWAYDMAV